jgi:hypothetical protein
MARLKDRTAWFHKALKIAEDPTTSAWLKNALMEAINRDPADAAEDAEVLSGILQLRAAAVQREPVTKEAAGRSTKAAS